MNQRREEIEEQIHWVRDGIVSFFTGEHPDIGDLLDDIDRLIQLRIEAALLKESP